MGEKFSLSDETQSATPEMPHDRRDPVSRKSNVLSRMIQRSIALVNRNRDATVSIAVRIAAAMAGFLVTVLVASRLGASAIGVYGLVTQTAMFFSIVAVAGLDFVVVRRFSAALAKGFAIEPWDILRVFFTTWFLCSITATLTLAAYLALDQLMFDLDQSMLIFVAIFVLLFCRATTRISSAVLRSFRFIFSSQLVEVLFIPLAISVIILCSIARSLEALLAFLVIVSLCAAALGVILSLKSAVVHSSSKISDLGGADVAARGMIKEGLPLGAAAVMLSFADWYGLAIVASMEGAYNAGLFRVASQIAMTIGIITTGLASSQAASISSAFAIGDRLMLGTILRSSSQLATILAVLIGIALIFGGKLLLGLAGPEYGDAYVILLLLASAQLAALVISAAGVALAMTGHGRVHFPVTLGASLVLLVIAPVASIFWGTVGVAAAVALVQLGRVLAYVCIARQKLGIDVITGRPVAS